VESKCYSPHASDIATEDPLDTGIFVPSLNQSGCPPIPLSSFIRVYWISAAVEYPLSLPYHPSPMNLDMQFDLNQS